MPAYPNHQDLRPAYVQDTDPGAVGAGVFWADTTVRPWVIKIRNFADTGWELTAGGLIGPPGFAEEGEEGEPGPPGPAAPCCPTSSVITGPTVFFESEEGEEGPPGPPAQCCFSSSSPSIVGPIVIEGDEGEEGAPSLIPGPPGASGSGAAEDAWIAAGETWTYTSADDPTFTFTIAGIDLTAKYTPGTRIKLTQTTVKYFIVTKVAFSTDTTVTIYGGTDHDLANAAITSPFFSRSKAPAEFPLDPAKWTQTFSDTVTRTQSSPVTGTWYNLGTSALEIPIGAWRVYYAAVLAVERASVTTLQGYATLSTANNSETDHAMNAFVLIAGASGNLEAWNNVSRETYIVLAAKTSYFLNAKAGGSADAISFAGGVSTTTIKATSEYL